MAQLNDHANSDELAKLLVGNKCDLEDSREVTKEKADMFCSEYGMEHLETSAKSGVNVLKAFERLITIVHEKNLAARSGGGGAGGGSGMGGKNDNAVKLDEGNVRGEGSSAAADGSSSCGC